MAYKYEKADQLIAAAQASEMRPEVQNFPILPERLPHSLEDIARQIYTELSSFAEGTISKLFPVRISGYTLNTSDVYNHPLAKMIVFTMEPAHNPPSEPPILPTGADPVDLYDLTKINKSAYIQVASEQRPQNSGQVYEFVVSSWKETPETIITNLGRNVRRVISPNPEPLTTLKIDYQGEDPTTTATQVSQMIEGLTANILAHHQTIRRTNLHIIEEQTQPQLNSQSPQLKNAA